MLDLMNARATTFAFCFALLGSLAFAQDDRPVFKESTTNLVAVIDSTARANFEVACLNVTREAAQKKLRIYALTPKAKTGTVKEGDFVERASGRASSYCSPRARPHPQFVWRLTRSGSQGGD